MFKNWYLIQTKPREECVAEKNISSQGIEVYLPKFALNKKDKPLFPGYIFVHLADNINWKPLLCSGPLILDTFQATFSNSAIF